MLDFTEDKIPKNLFIHLFIHHLISACFMPDTGDVSVNVTDKIPCCYGMPYWGRHKQINKSNIYYVIW